jgi:hypothetical protein
MITEDGVKIQNGYKIRGIEPPDLRDYEPSTRKLFWSWVVEFGLKRKDKELSQGLDKDGRPLRPISEETRKHRKSAMTPSGKGDPEAPPLTPGYQKSRTRSLLAGRAFSTHADFFWRYDAWTGDSWAKVLSYQAAKGRDVFGLSKAGTAWVKGQAYAKWKRWKEGKVRATPQAQPRQIAVPQFGRYSAEHIEHGVSTSGGTAAFIPGKFTGFTTPEERRKYFTQTAAAVLPGRPSNPGSKHPDVGPKYNRLLQHVWGGQTFPGRGGSPPAPPKPPPKPPSKPPKKSPPKPPAPAPKPAPAPPSPARPTPGQFTHIDQVQKWAQETFPNAKVDLSYIQLDAWNVITGELNHLAGKFPGIKERMLEFGSMAVSAGGDNTIAQAVAGSGRLLQFNPVWWSDLKKLGETFAAGVESEFHPLSVQHAGPKYYVTHEVGHLVDGLLESSNNKAWKKLVSNFRGKDGRFDSTEARRVSDYGSTSEVEAFAESFAAARWRQADITKNPIVKAFREVLDP